MGIIIKRPDYPSVYTYISFTLTKSLRPSTEHV